MNEHEHEWHGEWFDLWSCQTCGEYVTSENMPAEEMERTLARVAVEDARRRESWAKPSPVVPEGERIPTLWRKAAPGP